MNKKKAAAAAAVVLAAVLGVNALSGGFRGKENTVPSGLREETVVRGDIERKVMGTGALAPDSTLEVTVPVGIKIDKVFFEAGDVVHEGDIIATVNELSVKEELLKIQEQIDKLSDEIDDLDKKDSNYNLTKEVKQAQIEDLRVTRDEMRFLRESLVIVSDADGIVENVNLREGESVVKMSGSSGNGNIPAVDLSSLLQGRADTGSPVPQLQYTAKVPRTATAAPDTGETDPPAAAGDGSGDGTDTAGSGASPEPYSDGNESAAEPASEQNGSPAEPAADGNGSSSEPAAEGNGSPAEPAAEQNRSSAGLSSENEESPSEPASAETKALTGSGAAMLQSGAKGSSDTNGDGDGTEPGTNPESGDGTEPGTNPEPGEGTEPGTNPEPGDGTEPGTNPEPGEGTEPGTNPEPGEGTEPGTNPEPGDGTEPGTDPEPGDGTEPGTDPDPGTDGKTPAPIYGALILHVVPPVRGNEPQSELEFAAEPPFTAEIIWSPETEDVFAEDTVYTANVTLTAKEGYYFLPELNGVKTLDIRADSNPAAEPQIFDLDKDGNAETVKLVLTYPSTGKEDQQEQPQQPAITAEELAELLRQAVENAQSQGLTQEQIEQIVNGIIESQTGQTLSGEELTALVQEYLSTLDQEEITKTVQETVSGAVNEAITEALTGSDENGLAGTIGETVGEAIKEGVKEAVSDSIKDGGLGGLTGDGDLSGLAGLTGDTDLSGLSGLTGAADLSGLSGLSGLPDLSGFSAGSVDLSGSSSYSPSRTAGITVIPTDKMLLDINVDEMDINSVTVGQKAMITLDALGSKEFPGEIAKVAQTAQNSGGVAKYVVRLTLEKTDEMKFGMSATASVVVESKENVLLIPIDALQSDGKDTIVYTGTDEKGNLIDPVKVTTGLSNSEMAEITGGLSEGDHYVYFPSTASSIMEIMYERSEELQEQSGR